MTDLERVLSRLLHDLRSPMGVASGYLRLVRDGQLTGADDVTRALGKAQDALRAMAGVCGDATAWLDFEPAAAPHRVALARFLSRVATHAATRLPGLTLPPAGDAVTLTLTFGDDRVAGAVVELLATVSAPSQSPCAAGLDGGTLWFAVQSELEGQGHAPAAFDPWRFPGFAAPLAHRAVVQGGGRCGTAADAGQRLRVEFTLDPA
jgi:hypothetical protein